MPYADPEKQREADRKRKARARAEKKLRNSRKFARKPDVRARAWTFIVYPESAPENWRDVLDPGFTFNGRAVRFTIAT